MYYEIGAVKKPIAQYNNDINLFFDSIRSVKLQINSKNPLAYTNDASVHEFFVQLMNEILPHDFKSKFTSLERCWQMDKEIVISQSLVDDSSTCHTNLVVSGNWKTEVSNHAQIIALTTQILEFKKEGSQIKASANTFTPAPALSGTGSNQLEQWRIEKVDNKEEFINIMKDGKNYYWCDQHKYASSAT
jgi:hypothetical protein